MSRYVIGVDGGGTTARAVVLTPEGREVARAIEQGAVVTARAPSDAVESVRAVVLAAARAAHVELPAAALWAGLAGAGREPARSAVEAPLKAAGLADELVVGTDLDAAVYSALGVEPGIVLLAGTGSVAVGRSEAGLEHRVGGWGERLGDEGSGFWIGLEALRRIVRAEDGRGPPTTLTVRLLEWLELTGLDEVIIWAEQAKKGEIAALAPAVFASWDGGDQVAAEIASDAADALARHVEVAYERAGPWSKRPPLALWGGLIGKDGPLRRMLLAALDPLEIELLGSTVDPARGAADKALELFMSTHG